MKPAQPRLSYGDPARYVTRLYVAEDCLDLAYTQEIIARAKLPVTVVGERDKLEPNHVYVIPPNRRLQLVDHELSALEFDEPRGQRAPIDLLLRSVAERVGDGMVRDPRVEYTHALSVKPLRGPRPAGAAIAAVAA